MALASFLVFGLTGCGVVLWGTPLLILATQKTTSELKTSAPDAQPTADVAPAFATLQLSTAKVTAMRNGVPVTDFQITGFQFPAGYGQSQSNRDTDTTIVTGDALVIRIDGDDAQLLSFSATDATATVGTAVAAAIQAKVNALMPVSKSVAAAAYTQFTASFDPISNSYLFVSGDAGESSAVVFQPAAQTGDTVKVNAASAATAARLGLGVANGGIETTGGQSIAVDVLNSGSDVVPSGSAISLFISHQKTLDATALQIDAIETNTAIAVGEARKFFRVNGNAPPTLLLLQDVTPGAYYLIFQVAAVNGDKDLTDKTLTASHPIMIYEPVADPTKVNAIDFAITATTSPISIVTSQVFASSVAVTNLGGAVPAGGVNMGIDVVLSGQPAPEPAAAGTTFPEPAVIQDPAGQIAGVRINPTDPSIPITVNFTTGTVAAVTSDGCIAASINSTTITVQYDPSQTAPGLVVTVQSLVDTLNNTPALFGSSGTSLVDAFTDGNGNPSVNTLSSLLATGVLLDGQAVTSNNKTQVVAASVFIAHTSVTFPATGTSTMTPSIQTQTFFLGGTVRSTAVESTLLPVNLYPLYRITPQVQGTSALPFNTLDKVRQGFNYVRIFDVAQATYDTTTGATLPTDSSSDFTVLTAVQQRPVNSGTITVGHPKVLSFQIPDTGLSVDASQLLVIVHTTDMDPHVDLLSSTGEFLVGGEATTLPKTVVLYTSAQSLSSNRVFYAVVAPARFDEADIPGTGEPFSIEISVFSQEPGDLGLANGDNVDNLLRPTKAAFNVSSLPGTENNVLIPFSLENGKAELVFSLAQAARVSFSTTPVFNVGTSAIITQFLAGQEPAPLDFQPVLDETLSRIVYRPTTGTVDTPFILDAGVYTIAFETGNGVPDTQGLRLEVDTQFVTPSQ